MRVCVAVEHRFQRLPDGSVWTRNQQFAHWSWRRYLDAFDDVLVVARVEDVDGFDGDRHRADGEHVSFGGLPHYVGPWQFLRRAAQIRRAVRDLVRPEDAFILRVPGIVGDLVWTRLRTAGHPYGVEVVGDPHDVFSRGAVRHPLRAFFRWRATRKLRLECRHAAALSYVTERALQARYPPGGPAIAASSIELPDDAFAATPHTFVPREGVAARLLFVGSLEQYYKGPDVLIRALALLADRGHRVALTIVGAGRLRADLEALAVTLGCRDSVHFAGHLATRAVFAELDRADLFVLPSRTEGLPRAMLEAMTRGLPCVGSRAGGITELLPSEATVPPGDPLALTGTIAALLTDPPLMHAMAARNILKAREFRSGILQERRLRFYSRLREGTEQRVGRGPKVAHIATVDLSIRLLLLNQLRSLSKAGYNVLAVSAAGPDVLHVEQAGIPHAAVPLTRRWSPWLDLAALASLWRLIVRERAAIVHTHTPKPGLLGQLAAKLAGTPIVVNTIHGFYFSDRTPRMRRRVIIWLERLTARWSDLILFVSREDFDTASRERIGHSGNRVLLGNGVDLTRFDPARIDRAEGQALRKRLGIPEGRKIVGFVGRLVREKGLLDLLSAIRSVRETVPDVHVLIVGPIEPDKTDAIGPEICRQYGVEDICTFAGMRDDMPELFALMDVFALPSYREGCPRSLMEASAMGIASVATDIPGCRQVVADGSNGLLVPVGDPPALAAAIGRLLRSADMRHTMGARGRTIAATTFDELAVFATLEHEYARLIRQKRLAPALAQPIEVTPA